MLRVFSKANNLSYALLRRSFSAAAVPLSQQTTLEDDLDEFFSTMGKRDKPMDLHNLTHLMQNSFIDRHFTFDEHQSYAPVIEELVFYAKDWI